VRTVLEALRKDESAQDTTEYVLLVAVVALAVTAGIAVLATAINTAFSQAGGSLLPTP
jgi:Flp pilus assembly pilin Flp